MIKRYKESISINLPACKVSPIPPIGPMLGQRGIQIMEFSKKFNDASKNYKDSCMIHTKIFVGKDRSYLFNICKPSLINLLRDIYNVRVINNEVRIHLRTIYEFVKLNGSENENKDVKSIINMLRSSKCTLII